MSYIHIEIKSKGCFYRGQTHGQTVSVQQPILPVLVIYRKVHNIPRGHEYIY